MIINILGGGPQSLLPDLKQYDSTGSKWLGVDRGVFTLLNEGIQPHYAFGDFDSVSDDEWRRIESEVGNLIKVKPEKDETDMELALNWALLQKPQQINLFGATGGRLDHFFGNVQILMKPVLENLETHVEIIDGQNHLFAKGPGSYSISRRPDRTYISFIPMSPSVEGLTLAGFKYPLSGRNISLGSTLCISNELVGEHGTFSFSEGILLVVSSRD
jgi:thiamine pyrophosphokinase